jgi:hypothetical protein
MARLPVPRRRKKPNPAQAAIARVAAAFTAAKLSIAGVRAAKKGAKAYGAVKGAKVVGRPVVKVAAIPVTVAGGVVVWRKLKSSSSASDSDVGRPLGPVASAETVSPPADAAVGAAGNEAHGS